MIPKQPRQKDPKYLDFIREKPCLCKVQKFHIDACLGQIVPHHTVSRGAWGSDYRTIPLCTFHHFEIEKIGLSSMESFYHFNALDEIIKLLSEYLRKKDDN